MAEPIQREPMKRGAKQPPGRGIFSSQSTEGDPAVKAGIQVLIQDLVTHPRIATTHGCEPDILHEPLCETEGDCWQRACLEVSVRIGSHL